MLTKAIDITQYAVINIFLIVMLNINHTKKRFWTKDTGCKEKFKVQFEIKFISYSNTENINS